MKYYKAGQQEDGYKGYSTNYQDLNIDIYKVELWKIVKEILRLLDCDIQKLEDQIFLKFIEDGENNDDVTVFRTICHGRAEYSEYFIEHSGSTYWRKKDSEKAELFRKIEPYITYLNIHQLERQGAGIQTKVEELEELNQSLRQCDKVKDDAIAQLSDQTCVFIS